MRLAAIVPSAGSGRRMNIKTDKPLIRLCNQELILYSLKILDKCKLISEIVVPTSTKNIKKIKKPTVMPPFPRAERKKNGE